MTTLAATGLPAEGSGRRGAVARLIDAIIEARSRQAERIVAVYLLRLDDATLQALGRDRADLERIAGSIVF